MITSAGQTTIPAPVFAVFWTFTAFEDLTLRQVTFGSLPNSSTSSVLSTDPSLSIPVEGRSNYDFQLYSYLKREWTDLVFPVPKGTKLYWGIDTNDLGYQLISLLFT